MKKQRLLSILLVICLAVSMFSVTAGAIDVSNFKDVKESDWFYDYVKFVTSKGYFEGVSDTEFAPKDTMTRAMFVTVLARVEGVKVDNTKSAFSDVPANTWYTGAVTWAAQNKIVDGVSDDKFAPNAAVTREQMCAIMERYMTNCKKVVKGTAKVAAFNDVAEISDWAAKSVEVCRKLGLIDGFEDGSFRPTETSTRAQVAAVETRLCEVVVNEGSNPGPGPFFPGPGPSNPVYTDYIFDAVSAAGQDSVALVQDTITALANYAGITTANTAVSVDDFVASVATDSTGTSRPQQVTAHVALSSTLAREVVSIATSYANAILGGTFTKADVKDIVDDVVDTVEAELGITLATADRTAIVEAVYTAGSNRVAPIWNHFKGANGYYTGNITVTVGAASAVLNVNDTTGVSVAGSKRAAVKDLAVAIAKQAFANVNDPNFVGNVDANNDGWFEELNASAEVVLTFSAPANADYAEHTNYYNVYEYPFTLNMMLDGEGLVQYKYDGGADVMLYISQANQNRYETAIAKAVSVALARPEVTTRIKDAVNAMIDPYVDLTSGPLASMLPAEVGQSVREGLQTQLATAIKAWFYANSGISLTNGTDTGIEGSYFFEKFWNKDNSAVRNDTALTNLELVLQTTIETAINAKIDQLVEQAFDAVKTAAEGTTEFQDVVNSTLLTPTQKEEAKAEIYAAVAEEALKQSPFNFANPTVPAASWETAFTSYARRAITDDVRAAAPTIADGQIVSTVSTYIENNAYMAYIEQATNLKSFDTMDDVVLGNIAGALTNATVQSYIAAYDSNSYLVKIADKFDRIPAGATLTLSKNGTTVATITSAQVAAIQGAATPAAVCNAIADLLNTTGISTLSISDFAGGMDVIANYNGRTVGFTLFIEAA